jgi:hypothetical protein
VSTPYQGGVSQSDLGYGEGGASSYVPPTDLGYGNSAQPMTEEGHPDVEGTSVGQLIGDVTRDLSTLMRQELELAKAELKADANKATDEGHPDVEGTSVGSLIGDVTRDMSTLMRQELELAKAELKAEATKAGTGAGLFGAAGFAGYMVLMFLSIALWWALSHLVGHSWSALIVAVLWGIVGAVAFVMGKKKFQQVNPKPERTVETLQQVPGALKPN